jgi:hypothetical protein
MIESYSWPRSAAGAAGERIDRSQRKRDPVPQADDDNKSSPQQQQGDGQTDTEKQQQQGVPPRITDWASI